VLELTIDPQRKRFDPNTAPHHHLICVKCGAIADIHSKYSLNVSSGEASGFEIIGNHIEFYGICPVCKGRGGEADGGF
jgi:Fur family peroxide stress response transcriptional regulator